MIFNLVQYLRNNLTSLTFSVNGFDPDSVEDQLMVSETGGEPQHWYPRTDWTVQILSRAGSSVVAKENIESVYTLLENKFGIVLPAVTVNNVVYPLVQTYQISPIQTPGYIGASREHLEMFSFNLTITTD